MNRRLETSREILRGFTLIEMLVVMGTMAVLAGIMAIVAFKTFNWHSVQPTTVKGAPIAETLVMLVTVAATVYTGNLAIGVVGGIIIMAIIPARLKLKHAVTSGKSSPTQGK